MKRVQIPLWTIVTGQASIAVVVVAVQIPLWTIVTSAYRHFCEDEPPFRFLYGRL